MDKSDKEFLLALQHELNTQDNCGNREPVYWLIREDHTEPTSGEYADGWAIYDDEGMEMGKENDIESVIQDIKKFSGADIHPDLMERLEDVDGPEDLIDTLEDMDIHDYNIAWLRHTGRYANDAMFITLQDCKDHIAKYGYNYKNPRPYANTADRSPKFEHLLDIIKKTNWEEE
jgi:hypothetical protein